MVTALKVVGGFAVLLLAMYLFDACTGAVADVVPWRTPANSTVPGVSCYDEYNDWYSEQVEIHGGVPNGLVYDPQSACAGE